MDYLFHIFMFVNKIFKLFSGQRENATGRLKSVLLHISTRHPAIHRGTGFDISVMPGGKWAAQNWCIISLDKVYISLIENIYKFIIITNKQK